MATIDQPTPLFIFSLPRSGSTLLQKILASNDSIKTVAEPWIMLPPFSHLENLNIWSAYSGKAYRTAIKNLIPTLPKGENTLLEATHDYGMSIYTSMSDGKRYFLDKTPRYHLIASHLIKTFPNGKFIFLWRNPLAVMASISRTWKKDRWTFESYKIDLLEGLPNLLKAYSENSNQCLALRYEDLITSPDEELTKIESYLDLPPDSCSRDSLSDKATKGKMGDPTGTKEYSDKISSKSIDRWQHSFNTRLRKKTGSDYLNLLGDEPLSSMGYSMDDLLSKLQEIPTTAIGISDYYYRLIDSMRTRKQTKLVRTMMKTTPRYRLR